ncbi:MAG TPA: endonuclease/exonuclease/phosphatase family protein [Terriglobales bacterium]
MRINPRTHARRWLTRARLPVQALLALLLVVPVVAQNRPAESRMQGEGSLKAMTYNMYAGTEYAGVTDPNLDVVLQAVTNMILDARASDPPGRAQAIARQIAATRPHLVSLQEVATWSTGPTKDNLTVEFDYLQLLLDTLAAQGAQYTPVASFTIWDVTVPSTFGFVRNTWRVAILARADLKPEDISFTNVQAAKWLPGNTLLIPLPALNGRPDLCPVPLTSSLCVMPFPRGWASVDVMYRGKQLRYINAHLESSSASRNIRQGLELLTGAANTALPVVVAADLNCDLSNPSDPKYPTCLNFLNAGFIDAWSAANPSEPGYTKDLPVMTKRGDYVMVLGRFRVQAAALVGEEVGDMTPTGLWPSNHCGVVARLQLPGEE